MTEAAVPVEAAPSVASAKGATINCVGLRAVVPLLVGVFLLRRVLRAR